MRYAIGTVTLLLMPWLVACGQSGSPVSPQTLSAVPTGVTSDDTADTLALKGTTALKGTLDGQLTSSTTPVSFLSNRVITAGGHAARFGRFTLTISFVRNDAASTEDGSYQITTSKGDSFGGSFSTSNALRVNGVITATDTVAILSGTGTGRFAGATGTFQVERTYTDSVGGNAAGTINGAVTLP
jgi:hypothetical protein